jgi:hypothetical protein
MAKKTKLFDEIPRKLTNRNPFNSLDVSVALGLIHQINGTYVTQNTLNKLASLGFDRNQPLLPKGLKLLRHNKQMSDAYMIGSHLKVENPKQYPWQCKIVACSLCKSLLTVSTGHEFEIERYLCCFCAADLVIAEYWRARDGKTNKT